ncbi:MAG TPA: hypothetical protein VGJ00_05015 [Rhabdochlamydiaceae bacterium]|jgi:hypothetical protein
MTTTTDNTNIATSHSYVITCPHPAPTGRLGDRTVELQFDPAVVQGGGGPLGDNDMEVQLHPQPQPQQPAVNNVQNRIKFSYNIGQYDEPINAINNMPQAPNVATPAQNFETALIAHHNATHPGVLPIAAFAEWDYNFRTGVVEYYLLNDPTHTPHYVRGLNVFDRNGPPVTDKDRMVDNVKLMEGLLDRVHPKRPPNLHWTKDHGYIIRNGPSVEYTPYKRFTDKKFGEASQLARTHAGLHAHAAHLVVDTVAPRQRKLKQATANEIARLEGIPLGVGGAARALTDQEQAQLGALRTYEKQLEILDGYAVEMAKFYADVAVANPVDLNNPAQVKTFVDGVIADMATSRTQAEGQHNRIKRLWRDKMGKLDSEKDKEYGLVIAGLALKEMGVRAGRSVASLQTLLYKLYSQRSMDYAPFGQEHQLMSFLSNNPAQARMQTELAISLPLADQAQAEVLAGVLIADMATMP